MWTVLTIIGMAFNLVPRLFAQSPDATFEHLSLAEGLSQSTVSAILQDHKGYLWFATLNGLNRYDGYVFAHFRHIPDDTNSISSDQIAALFEDRDNNLWVGTAFGLNKFDRKQQRFVRFLHNPNDSTSVSNDNVNVIFEDRHGDLWVGTSYGLNRFDRETATFSHLFYDPNSPLSLSHNRVLSLAEDSQGNLWIGTQRGLGKLDPEREHVQNYINFGNQYGQRYRPSLLQAMRKLLHSTRPIASILSVGDGQNLATEVSLTQESDLLVVVTGEALENQFDYGWIERSGETIWKMDLTESRYAGGHVKNRMQLETLTLAAGTYELHYRSDDSHSFGKWNGLPPDFQDCWGIQIVRLTPQQKEIVDSLIRDVFIEPVPLNNNIPTIVATRDGCLWLGTAGGGIYKLADALSKTASSGQAIEIEPPQRRARAPASRNGLRFAGVTAPTDRDAVVEKDPSEVVPFYLRYPDELTVRYDEAVYEKITDLKATRRPLAEITKVQNFSDLKRSFKVTSLSHVLIVAMGEGGRLMVDYGSLERNGKTVWKMDMAVTRHAGGGIKNREAIVPLELRPGEYVLRYRSDHNHSYQKWNRLPPDHPDRWGIQLFAVTRKEATDIAPLLARKVFPTQIAGNSIRDILEDRNGYLWVATASGLSKFDPEKESFVNYHHSATNPNSLSTDDIQTIYQDRAGTVWVGTILAGIDKVNIRKNRFEKFTANPFVENSLSNELIYAFAEDAHGGLWIGTRNGISLFNRADRQFINFAQSSAILGHITGMVSSIMRDDHNNLWFGSTSGLYLASPDQLILDNPPMSVADFASERSGESQAFIHFRHEPGNDNSLGSNPVQKVVQDRRGDIWLATADGGLDRLVIQKGQLNWADHVQFFHHRARAGQAGTLPSNRLRTVFEDKAGTIWVGTNGAGLCRFDRARETFLCYHNIPGVKSSLSHDVVNDIFEDEGGKLWIATYGGGLNRFDPDTGRFQRFLEEDGLPNNVVYGVLPDDLGNIWISTNKGLCRLNLKTGNIKNYDMSNGVQSNEFNTGAFQRLANGDLVFGGINGFNIIDPADVVDNPNPPSLVITAVKTFDEPLQFDRDISELDKIELSYKQNFISFEFAALDYTDPKKNQYAYKLQNFNKKWVACGNQRSASFSNLNSGEYVFRVIGANNDGVWNKTGTALRIIITPPFWRTGWFTFLTLFLAMTGLVLVHRSRVRKKVAQSLQFERIRLQEREHVREQVSRDYHDALGHKLTKISLFSELLRRNINGSGRSSDYLNKIVSASTSLGKETRDFIWTLDPDKDRLYDLAIYLNQFGESLFDDTPVEFRAAKLSDSLEKVLLTMDWKRQISFIFKEALHNVLKHAACEHCQLRFDAKGDLLRIAVADDGSGFDRNAGGQNNDTGTGNGLRNMQARAQAIGGELQIVSGAARGTTVRLAMRFHTQEKPKA